MAAPCPGEGRSGDQKDPGPERMSPPRAGGVFGDAGAALGCLLSAWGGSQKVSPRGAAGGATATAVATGAELLDLVKAEVFGPGCELTGALPRHRY